MQRAHSRRALGRYWTTLSLTAAAGAVLAAQRVQAQSTWVGGQGNWSDGAHWSPAFAPTSGQVVINNGTNAAANVLANTTVSLTSLLVDGVNGGQASLSLTGASPRFTVTGNTTIGSTGAASVTNNGAASFNFGTLVLGALPGSSGSYSQSGGNLWGGLGGTLIVGGNATSQGGNGAFAMTGGSAAVSNLSIWRTGTVTLAGGVLYADTPFVLTNFTGTGANFNWTGGTVADFTDTPLTLLHGAINGVPIPTDSAPNLLTQSETISGRDASGGGTNEVYTQTAPVAITMTCTVDGKYNQTAGLHVIKNALQISSNLYAAGVYDLSGGVLDASAATGTNGSEVLDFAGGGSAIGSLNQSGGTNLSGVLVVGGYAGAGVYNQTGGLNAPQTLKLGVAGAAGSSFGASGFYRLGGTGVLAVTGDEYVSYDDLIHYSLKSDFTQDAGTHTVGGNLYVRDGTFHLNGGSLAVAGVEQMSSSFGVGAFTQTAGSNTAGSGLVIPGGLDYVYGGGPVVLSSYSLAGGTLVTPSVTNGGSFIQTGGAASLGAVSGTGITNVGGGTSFASLAVRSISQGNVSVGSNALLSIAASPSHLTNSITSLAVTGTGQLDLANQNLLLDRAATPLDSVRLMLRTGYNAATWNGPDVISSTAATDPRHYGIALIDGAAPGGVTGVAANQILLRGYTLYGDTQLRGFVDAQDYATLRSNFHSGATVTWAQGDFNYDGKVDLVDYLALARNVSPAAPSGSTARAAPAPAAALPPSLVLPAAGTLALEADPSTGHLYLVGNDVSVAAYDIDSVDTAFDAGLGGGGHFATLTGSPGLAQAWEVLQATSAHLAENVTPGTGSEYFAPGEYVDLAAAEGRLWNGADIADLSFDYGDANLDHHVGQVISVPEPTALGRFGWSVAAALLTRRRRPHPSALTGR